jgi:hypothetical protein
MISRDTGTGAVLERMVIPALEGGGYAVQKRIVVGERLGGGRHIADVLAEKDGRRLIGWRPRNAWLFQTLSLLKPLSAT